MTTELRYLPPRKLQGGYWKTDVFSPVRMELITVAKPQRWEIAASAKRHQHDAKVRTAPLCVEA